MTTAVRERVPAGDKVYNKFLSRCERCERSVYCNQLKPCKDFGRAINTNFNLYDGRYEASEEDHTR